MQKDTEKEVSSPPPPFPCLEAITAATVLWPSGDTLYIYEHAI